MRNLNKKGFTLVELLAVIVILALLIVVVATTALPALDNAKKSSLKTYSQKVIEQAKTYYTTACILDDDATKCQDTYVWDLKEIMGSDVADQYVAALKITKSGSVINVDGAISDAKNDITATIDDSKVTGTAATKEADCNNFKQDSCVGICTWEAADSKCVLSS